MALDNIPDYSIKAQVPMAAIIQAYQQKAAQEQQNKLQQQQMDMQKFDHTLSVFKSASDITRTLIDQSKIKQQQDALNSLSTLFANGQQPVQTGVAPTGTASLMSVPSPAASGPSVQTGTPTEAPLSSTPEYKFQLASLMTKANPSAFTANLADDVSKSVVAPSAPVTRASNFDIQRVDIPGKGPLTVKVDKINNKIYDLAGNDITAAASGAAPYAPPMLAKNSQEENVLVNRQDATAKTVTYDPQSKATVEEFTALPPAQQKRIVERSEQFLKDPIVTNIREKAGNLQEFNRLIDTALDKSPENQEAAKQAIGAMQGLATRSLGGEKGVTTDKDIQRNTGDQSYAGRFKRFIDIAATGKIPDDQLQGFKTLLNKINGAQEQKIDRIKESYIKPLKKTTRASEELLNSQFQIDLGNIQPTKQTGKPSLDSIFGGM